MSREIGQDIPIWEHKRYVESPALAPMEKPITEYRRWYSQFYCYEDEPAAAATAAPRG